ncbi:MAG: HAD family hydrolase [Bacteroidia bacterium]|jgi:D-glycero-D-manno-heptose 1,7-bisphosphate phosphatase|nr:HAD family hydrolase [Bacteroidia bacterium]
MEGAVFLDRDGIINKEIGDYIKSLDEFELLPHAITQIALLNQHKVKVFVVTNQGGIAKGLYSEETLAIIHKKMNQTLEAAGGLVTEVFYCPHHPDYGLCICRKPSSLLAQKAVAKYNLNPNNSIFIGDKPRDVTCAEGAGIRGILVSENEDWTPIIQAFLLQQFRTN